MFSRGKDDSVIVRVDGGFCSQLGFIAYAKHLVDNGLKVKLDLSWYEECGKGLDGRFSMPYVIDKIFSELNYEIASKDEIERYKKKYHYKNAPIDEIKAPSYVDGYPKERHLTFQRNKEYFKNNFNPKDIDDCIDILEKIKNHQSCAIHVRRGDLSNYTGCYGYPPEKEYFLKAIKIVKALLGNVSFFFFSEEPDWIRENIAPYIDKDINFEIIDRNPSEKGYLDLCLMTYADCIISSQGSMGGYAQILSKKDATLIVSKMSNISGNCNCIYINEDERLRMKYEKDGQKESEAQKEDPNRKHLNILGIKISYKAKKKEEK